MSGFDRVDLIWIDISWRDMRCMIEVGGRRFRRSCRADRRESHWDIRHIASRDDVWHLPANISLDLIITADKI